MRGMEGRIDTPHQIPNFDAWQNLHRDFRQAHCSRITSSRLCRDNSAKAPARLHRRHWDLKCHKVDSDESGGRCCHSSLENLAPRLDHSLQCKRNPPSTRSNHRLGLILQKHADASQPGKRKGICPSSQPLCKLLNTQGHSTLPLFARTSVDHKIAGLL